MPWSCAAQTRFYKNGKLDADGFPVEDVSEYLKEADGLVWVDLCGPTMSDLEQLAGELGIHELAVEDAIEEHQRPKLDRYGTHFFMATHAVEIDPEKAELVDSEVDAFIGDHWMITVRKDEAFSMAPVIERWERTPDLATNGVSVLLYGLLDVVVDGYFDAVEAFDIYYDDVSDSIFADHPVEPSQQHHWFQMRQALVKFHRLVSPTREAISGLIRHHDLHVPDGMAPYFQDLYDHILVIGESGDALRDLVSSIVETNISLRDYRQNQIMKQVTSWAAIIAVPTLITGFYGMNVPYPGYGDTWGFVASVVLIVLLSGGLYRVFRRRGWL